jgi:enoyl reductase
MYMRRVLALIALLPSLLLAGLYAATPAAADQCESASADPTSIVTAICLTGSGLGAGSLPVPVGWTPPTCWLEPRYQPQPLDTLLTALNDSSIGAVGSEGAQYYGELYNYYSQQFTPPFHVGDSGWWWGVACRADDLNASTDAEPIFAAAGLSVTTPWEWVPDVPPGNVTAATPELLAEYAAAEMSLPDAPTPEISPIGKQTVGLATWVWGRVSAEPNLSITATLAGVGTSTVTATPESVTISPGGDSNPSSVTCPVATTDGGATFGTAYTANGSSDCSFKYLHPTPAGQVNDLVIAVRWRIDWVGHDGGAWPVFLTTTSGGTPLTVQEVEAVVGGCPAGEAC